MNKKKFILLLIAFVYFNNSSAQFSWLNYATQANASRGRTFTRDAYTFSAAGTGAVAGNTMTAKVSHFGPNRGSDETNYSGSCGTGAANQIHISTEYFSTGLLDPCYYYCPPVDDPSLVTAGLWLGVDWPDKTSYVDVDMTFTLPAYGVNFQIYDINQNNASGPFSDLVTISAITCSGATVYPVSVSNLDAPYAYNAATGTVYPTNTNTGAGTLYSTVTFANVGIVSMKISYKSNPTITGANPSDPGYQFIIVLDINASNGSSSPLTINSSASTICSGNSTTLTATSGYSSYSWMPGGATTQSITVSPGATSTYTVTALDAGGCSVSNSATINVNAPFTVSVSPATICSGQQTTLTAVLGGSPPNPAPTYSWSNGAAGNTITVTPSVTTTYTVTASSGCSATNTVTVTVNTSPIVSASGGSTICSGKIVTLSANGATTYSWSPGGETTASINVSPTTSASYTVTGTAANGCTAVATAPLTYLVSPVAVASAIPAAICSGNPVALTGMPAAVNTSNTTHTFETLNPFTLINGGGTIRWRYGNFDKCNGTQSLYIGTANNNNNYGALQAAVNFAYIDVLVNSCTATLSFNWKCAGKATDNLSVWIVPDTYTPVAGTALAASASVLKIGGDYWNAGAVCNNVSSINLIQGWVTPGQTIRLVFQARNASALAVTNPAPLIDDILISKGTVNTYSWTSSATAFTSTNQNPIDTPAVSTTYNLVVTSCNGCTSSSSTSVTVNSSLPVTISGDSIICNGGSTTLTASGGTSYLWSTGETTSVITVTPSSNTNYSVNVSNGSCSGNASVNVSISSTLNIKSDYYICESGTVMLSASGGTSYNWSPGWSLDDSTSATPLASPVATTTYTVAIINGICTYTSLVTVHLVFPPTPPSISQNKDSIFVAQNYTSYQWYFNGTPIPGATDYYYLISLSGSGYYSVLVTDSFGCRVISQSSYFVDGTYIYTEGEGQGIHIYPNPAKNKLTIWSTKYSVLSTEIYNAIGENIYSSKSEFVTRNSEIKIDIRLLPPGVYFVRIKNEKGIWNGRFVKQ